MRRDSRIFIVGHQDSVENALQVYFQNQGFHHTVTNTHDGVNVLKPSSVEDFFKKFKHQYVFLGPVRCGGIAAHSTHPAEFIFENSQAQNLVIDAARRYNVKKLLYLASSCMYPVDARQPIQETALGTGALEKSSEAYAVAKIAGVAMCQAYRRQYGLKTIVAVPATVYGPGSDIDAQNAHVLDALIAKFCKANRENALDVVVWGTGRPRREFLYVDDFVSACVFLMDHYDTSDPINIGTGYDVTIRQLAVMIKKLSGFKGTIIFDASKPEGAKRKLLDSTRMRGLGWKPKVSLADGIEQTSHWYLKNSIKGYL